MLKKNIRNNIKELLEEKPDLCKAENARFAVWEYWSKYEGAKWGVTKEAWLRHLTMPEKILEEIENYFYFFSKR